jgi:hypothetical protein
MYSACMRNTGMMTSPIEALVCAMPAGAAVYCNVSSFPHQHSCMSDVTICVIRWPHVLLSSHEFNKTSQFFSLIQSPA